MDELKSNSYRSRMQQRDVESSEPKHIERVITSEVRTKKKSGIHKFLDVIIGSGGVEDVTERLSTDIRKSIANSITDVVQMALVGTTSRGNSNNNGNRISYRNNYQQSGQNQSAVRVSKTTYDYEDIIFDTRGEAEKVLQSMDDVISRYGFISIGDMYDMVGITANYTDNKYGWTDLKGAHPERVNGGYILKLPSANPAN